MGDDGEDFLGTVLAEGCGRFGEGTAGICHVIDDDSDLVFDATDKDHPRDLVGSRAFLVDEGELQI